MKWYVVDGRLGCLDLCFALFPLSTISPLHSWVYSTFDIFTWCRQVCNNDSRLSYDLAPFVTILVNFLRAWLTSPYENKWESRPTTICSHDHAGAQSNGMAGAAHRKLGFNLPLIDMKLAAELLNGGTKSVCFTR